MSNSCAMAF